MQPGNTRAFLSVAVQIEGSRLRFSSSHSMPLVPACIQSLTCSQTSDSLCFSYPRVHHRVSCVRRLNRGSSDGRRLSVRACVCRSRVTCVKTSGRRIGRRGSGVLGMHFPKHRKESERERRRESEGERQGIEDRLSCSEAAADVPHDSCSHRRLLQQTL